jgi:hypothetical protein
MSAAQYEKMTFARRGARRAGRSCGQAAGGRSQELSSGERAHGRYNTAAWKKFTRELIDFAINFLWAFFLA